MNMRNGNFHIISVMLGQTMRKEDMIRMIESGEKLPDHYQEEFDKGEERWRNSFQII